MQEQFKFWLQMSMGPSQFPAKVLHGRRGWAQARTTYKCGGETTGHAIQGQRVSLQKSFGPVSHVSYEGLRLKRCTDVPKTAQWPHGTQGPRAQVSCHRLEFLKTMIQVSWGAWGMEITFATVVKMRNKIEMEVMPLLLQSSVPKETNCFTHLQGKTRSFSSCRF